MPSRIDRYRAVMHTPPDSCDLTPLPFKRYPTSDRRPLPWCSPGNGWHAHGSPGQGSPGDSPPGHSPPGHGSRDRGLPGQGSPGLGSRGHGSRGGLALLAAGLAAYAPTRVHYASVAGSALQSGAPIMVDYDPQWYELQVAGVRRPVPSGGAYYPGELYAAVPGDAGLAAGVYHYDPVNHALELVRPGDPSPQLTRATGGDPAAGGALLLACRLWKNAGKYGNLGHHLASLDVGGLLGEVIARLPGPARVRFFFLDDVLDDLLGLTPSIETVLAVVLLPHGSPSAKEPLAGVPPPAGGLDRDQANRSVVAPAGEPLAGVLSPAAGLERDQANRSIVDPAVVALTAASRIHDLDPSLAPTADPPPAPTADPPPAGSVSLPEPAAVPQEQVQRRSAVSFRPDPIPLTQLAAVLAAATAGFASDLAGTAHGAPPLSLYCVTAAVAGLDDGVHRYHPAAHAMTRTSPTPRLRAAVIGLDAQLVSAAVSLFLVAAYRAPAGDRWYRVANLLAGVMMQRICRAAAGLGLGSRPNLGFAPAAVADLLGLAAEEAPLLHVLVGHPAPRPGCLDLSLCDPAEAGR